MKRLPLSVIFVVFSLIMVSSTTGLTAERGLSTYYIESLRDDYHIGDNDEALFNALTANNINNLTLDRELLNSHNTLFNHKLKNAKGITAQRSSGRCWMFAGLNTLRPKMIEKYDLGGFEFSEIYLTFYDKLEKANTFLEQIIEMRDRDYMDRELEFILRRPFGDGGYWDYVVDLAEKYGLIPRESMPETHNSENTGMMNRLISRKLRQFASELRTMSAEGKSEEQLRSRKQVMLKEVYRMLALNFGEPPTKIVWQYEDKDTVLSKPREYTPVEFYRKAVDVDLKEYVSLVDYPGMERNKLYQIRLTRNMIDADDVTFINVDPELIKKLAMKCVIDDEPVKFSCDVGKENYRKKGILRTGIYDYSTFYGTDFKLTKQERLYLRESARNHAMVFIGVDVEDDKPVKWLVENSWGKERGDNGRWTMYDDWFDEYVYEVVIHRKYVPKEILKLLDTKPEILPVWDPMWEALYSE
ncbi:MAG: aminopeptidase [candidate division Zixibacteria bacterium]|nr:aminopeptidase [candidate division Zixibacteria bacterium]